MASPKPVNTIVLDAGPILKNDPSVSTLLAKAEKLYTVPAIVSEIRDPSARSRVETTLLPFLTISTPKANSIKFVRDFARKTGDIPVLSTPDIQVLALAYELELEQNHGDWRLRNTPGQRKLNGPKPEVQISSVEESNAASRADLDSKQSADTQGLTRADEPSAKNKHGTIHQTQSEVGLRGIDEMSKATDNLHIQNQGSDHSDVAETPQQNPTDSTEEITTEPNPPVSDSESSGSEGWITPSNLKKQQAKDVNASTEPISDDNVLQVGTLTGDFAMQVRRSKN